MIEKFFIKRLECRCGVCNSEFIIDNSNDNELVKMYFDDDEVGAKWIKMYGENGYLSLIEKLIGKGASDNISITTITILEDKLYEHFKKKITFDKGRRYCPKCNSKDVRIIKESIVESDEIALCNIEL
ncbi:MAG: hypothetical protein RR012_06615 [Oscillospiraceae bacterium]